ncbi:integrase core domain-containing protein [Acidisoma sp. L85]|uniref:integrase core domain-containing protein n=1 Tax=Acidisoma sp. L85 TaxID=1641850 RepID=UPI00352A4A82
MRAISASFLCERQLKARSPTAWQKPSCERSNATMWRSIPRLDAVTVIQSLAAWIDHYNALHPHRSLGYRSLREFIALKATSTGEVPLSGN